MKKIKNYELVSRSALILNYQIAGFVLWGLSFFSSIMLMLATIAAVLFAPYLLYVLFKEERFGWITTFFVMITPPVLLTLFLGISGEYFSIALLVSLGLFYLYCFIIRMSVNEWIREYNWSNELQKQKKEKEQTEELWLAQFKK